MPMHVGGLQLYKKPEGAGRNYVRDLFEEARDTTDIAPLFLKRPVPVDQDRRPVGVGRGRPVRHRAPRPAQRAAQARAGSASCSSSCSRLHSTRLATERPLWEWHLIEGLRDGRVAMYTKLHHSLVDGISAMRLLQSILSSDPDDRGMPSPWAKRPPSSKVGKAQEAAEHLAGRRDDERAADGAGHQRRRRRHPQGAGPDPQQEPAQRDLDALALRPEHDPEPRDHRLAPVRRPGLAARAHPRHRQGHRHDAERRGAGDVQRRDAHLPLRARRAPRHHPDRDGPGRPARPEVRRRRAAAATPSARSWSSSAPTCPTPSRG